MGTGVGDGDGVGDGVGVGVSVGRGVGDGVDVAATVAGVVVSSSDPLPEQAAREDINMTAANTAASLLMLNL